jgi:DNA-binding XRE family transcriptional regulator
VTRQTVDDVEDYIAERARSCPEFPALVQAGLERRRFLRTLATTREEQGLSRREVARRIGVGASVVARIESREVDPPLSLIRGYGIAIGHEVGFSLRPAP